MLNDICQTSSLLNSLGLQHARVVAICADNSAAWLAADMACVALHKPCVPLPIFFTLNQTRWAIESTGVDVLLTDQPENPDWVQLGFAPSGLYACGLTALLRYSSAVDLPSCTAKITFTSGSTGNPKGVCLSVAAQETVASSIAEIMASLGIKRHLCTLPLPVLLENVAGAYAAMLAGAECVTPSLINLGWKGSSQWYADDFLQVVQSLQIQSAIILPQMLKSLLPTINKFDVSSLRLLAVGGAHVAPELLSEARKKGLPVYQGYGLSECSSVVCLNLPKDEKSGAVGKPLKHACVRINEEGELEVAGAHFLGYVGQLRNKDDQWLPTGDLASIDSEGFVSIHGRKKNLIISSFGRNISPEWVESQLQAVPGILQSAVFGDGREFLVAVVVAPDLSASVLQDAVNGVNSRLPDYARVLRFIHANESFAFLNGMATNNGRNKREAINDWYSLEIDSLYREEVDA